MGGVQNRGDISTVPFIRYGMSLTKEGQTIKSNGSETLPLLPYTLMAKIAASQKWTPFISEAATDGTAIPQGIYMGPSIPAASIVAGDVLGAAILVGDALFDSSQLVIRAAKTLNTVITVGTTDLRTVEDHLADRGLFAENTVNFDEFENT